MSWVRMDDNFSDSPKISGLSDAAFRLQVAAICYCNRQLSDGFIEAAEVPRLVRTFRRAALAELVQKGIWLEVRIGETVAAYTLHDFLEWNEPREVVQARRDRAKDRANKSRAKHV